MCVSSWKKTKAELSTYFKYPEGIRKLIYTTNAMENFNRQLRKVSKNKTQFANDYALQKILYLAMVDLPVNGQVEYVAGIKSYPNYQYILKGGFN